MSTEEKVYRVPEDNLQAYASGQALTAIIPGLILYGIIAFFLLLFGFIHIQEGGLGLFQILGFLSVIFIFIFLVLAIGRQIKAEKQMRNTVFIINDTEIRSFRDESDKGVGEKITAGLIQARYGVQFENDTTISFSKIKNVKWKKKGIHIKGPNYDIFSGNGLIFVPVQLDGYETVKNTIEHKINRTNNG